MKKTKQMPKSFNITFFNEDNSSNKEVSMLRLKSELMQNRIFLNEHSFTKKDLILICQQYKIKVSAQQMKDAIINVLVKGILDSVSLHSHEEETPIDGEQPGPSGINPLENINNCIFHLLSTNFNLILLTYQYKVLLCE
jgi:hypothetical protein